MTITIQQRREEILYSIQSYVGCSLLNERAQLGKLISRGVDDPEQVVEIVTNCGMFMLGVWKDVGIQHELLNTKYKIGMAIGWVRQIGLNKGALISVAKAKEIGYKPQIGDSLHYYTNNSNNNHVEFCCENVIGDNWVVNHIGGGRPNNAITSGIGDIRWSFGRPLQEIIRFDKLIEI